MAESVPVSQIYILEKMRYNYYNLYYGEEAADI